MYSKHLATSVQYHMWNHGSYPLKETTHAPNTCTPSHVLGGHSQQSLRTPLRKNKRKTVRNAWFWGCMQRISVPAIPNTFAYHTRPVVQPEQRGGSSFGSAVKPQRKTGFRAKLPRNAECGYNNSDLKFAHALQLPNPAQSLVHPSTT